MTKTERLTIENEEQYEEHFEEFVDELRETAAMAAAADGYAITIEFRAGRVAQPHERER